MFKKRGLKKALFFLFSGLLSASALADDWDRDRGGYFRLDCRFHNEEEIAGARFCYASSVYESDEGRFLGVQLAVGCDYKTLFLDGGRVQQETTLDRISPLFAATPAIEVFPHGQLDREGSYTSVLDMELGRLSGLCYVRRIRGPDNDHRK